MLQIEIYSPDLEKEGNALVDSGLYPNPHAVMVEALENLVGIKKVARLDDAIESYEKDEITLGRAAELDEMHRFEFEEVLKAKGIVKEIEVDSVEKLETGVSVINSLHASNERTEKL